MRVVGVIVEHDERILLLHRREDKSEGGSWGLPAGKTEAGETDERTAVRELREETGIRIDPEMLQALPVYRWEFPKKSVTFPVFLYEPEHRPDVVIETDEHQGYEWFTPEEILALENPIHGLHDLISKEYFGTQMPGHVKKT